MNTATAISKVLLVEDDSTTNFISTMALKKVGIENVNAVLNGKEALETISTDCPDLIFLDISMPVMDGFEFLEKKREDGNCPRVRVAMLTSSMRPVDKERADSFDCVVDYIEKPLTSEKVGDVLSKL